MVHHDRTYVITNAVVYAHEKLLPHTSVVVEQGLITHVGAYEQERVKGFKHFDAKGRVVGPALVDMHIHGGGTFDMTGLSIQENLEGLALFLEGKGITSFQLAIVMDLKLLIAIKEALERSSFLSSYLLGVYAEGPFIAPEKKGGISLSSIRGFDREYLNAILGIKRGEKALVTTMTIAPELEGSDELTHLLEESGVVVAYGHSDAALDGLPPRKKNHLTHLFNAMSSIDHKQPGLAAMPFVSSFSHATYELVCDGVHVHPTILDLAITTLGTSRLCLISDAMSLAGMGKGEGRYLGEDIYSDGEACYYKESGTLIGSASLISETAKQLYQAGLLDRKSFFRVTSENPLGVLGQTDRGRVEPGYKADLVMLSSEMDIVKVFKAVGREDSTSE